MFTGQVGHARPDRLDASGIAWRSPRGRVGAAIRRVAAGRRLDGEAVERVVFALVAQRALKP